MARGAPLVIYLCILASASQAHADPVIAEARVDATVRRAATLTILPTGARLRASEHTVVTLPPRHTARPCGTMVPRACPTVLYDLP
jgi:hypothetical protein